VATGFRQRSSFTAFGFIRFSVSYRDIEELMAERGVTVTYESIRGEFSIIDA
jgi:transposase-like protein